jgi:hypothetical protein
VQFRLSAVDRERLGCPEWIEVDLRRVTIREAAEIQRRTGFASPDALLKAFIEPIVSGKPGEDPRVDYDSVITLIWLGLRRAGVSVPYDELDFDATEFDARPSEHERPVEAGKDLSIPTPTSDG